MADTKLDLSDMHCIILDRSLRELELYLLSNLRYLQSGALQSGAA